MPPSPRLLAAKGASVVVADLQTEKGDALAAEIGGVFVQVDVTKTDQITAAVNSAAEIASLRAVVNSAGIGWAQRTIGRDGRIDVNAEVIRIDGGVRMPPK